MMLKFLLLLPALVYATRYCTYTDDKCSEKEVCYGCITAPNLQGVDVSGGYELKDGDVYRETWNNGNCAGSPTTSYLVPTGKNTELDKCYTGNDYSTLAGTGSVKFGNLTDPVPVGTSNSVGISMIVLGLLLSLPFLK
eukprot:GHVR01137645.1.p1 GENE.GHVR01137645.1~~GHVR01137645.1.p1  ORF type:complete len:138 (+),score=10.64 GHVR01137645.1:73-486(+)